jgi:hypothetical protein
MFHFALFDIQSYQPDICILNTKNHSLSLTFLYFMSDSRVQRTMQSQRENKKCRKKIGEKVENYLNFHIFSFFLSISDSGGRPALTNVVPFQGWCLLFPSQHGGGVGGGGNRRDLVELNTASGVFF